MQSRGADLLDEEIVLIDALRLGARSYILKVVAGADLVGATEDVNRGEYHITPSLASRVQPRLLTLRTFRSSDAIRRGRFNL